MHPFLGKTEFPSASIFGAPEAFTFERWLKDASAIRVALAFGHMSGWRRVESAIKKSKADPVEVLLGQAFFQTEPALLFELTKLQAANPCFRVRLASSVTTFHPKIWIVTGNQSSQAIIGSSNLSSGGFSTNVECNLYTDVQETTKDIALWFADQWKIAHDLEGSFFNTYLEEYEKMKQQRAYLKTKMDVAQDALGLAEAKWRKKEALAKAVAFWKSDVGLKDVRDREEAILKMRTILNVPIFEFTAANYDEFVRFPELGSIRLAHVEGTKAALFQLKNALKEIGHITIAKSFNHLSKVFGIGLNLTTKLHAVYDPDKFIVVNGPVERALLSFGFSQEDLDSMDGLKYERFLKELDPFIEEARAQKTLPAAALDAFFYFYRGSATKA